MNWFEYLKLIGIVSLPQVLFFLALVLVGKSIIERYFKSSLETFKSELALSAEKNAHIFSSIHEKKIEAITTIYSGLMNLYLILYQIAMPRPLKQGEDRDVVDKEQY